MSNSIGFVLLTHTKPQQIYRLIAKLNSMFNAPPIVCHHDFSKCDLSVDTLPSNVTFVKPHIRTRWADFSLVEATLLGLQLISKNADVPDWTVLLSGSDYPIKTATQILAELTSSPYDAYIHHEEIKYKAYQRDWQKNCFDRYCTTVLSLPFLDKKIRPITLKKRLRHPLFTTPFLPFSKTLRCFAGSQWFCVNSRAVEYIIDFHSNKTALAQHYRRLMCADESYFQTILANAPHLKLQNDNLRYTHWLEGDFHPKTLSMADLPDIMASSAHFGRKFDIDIDSQILDELDHLVVQH